MKNSIFHNFSSKTPAYVYDAKSIVNILNSINNIKKDIKFLFLYSIKSSNNIGLLELIKPYVDGFSCSSLFELQLAKEVLDYSQVTHITTPGFNKDEFAKILKYTDFVSLNSLRQFMEFSTIIEPPTSCGIRINPQLSFVSDERFDPCRAFSKLGIPLVNFEKEIETNNINWSIIDGIHIHNNCESINFDEMKQTIHRVMSVLNKYKIDLKWLNLGGGYLVNSSQNISPLKDTIRWLRKNYEIDVYLEPGKAITGNAGYLIASVIDLFQYEDENIAVLDTSVNHLPEVFEYQYQPKVMNSHDRSNHKYHLVGCSCLSGDLFGEYYFVEPLSIGSHIIFENVGAYMQVKANMFNGINLPSVYLLENNNFKLLKNYDYNSFRDRL